MSDPREKEIVDYLGEKIDQLEEIRKRLLAQDEVIHIGEFKISRWSENSFWITPGGGEGGSFLTKKLEKVISDFYSENL